MFIRKISALASLVGAVAMFASVNASAGTLSVTYLGGTFSLSGVSSPGNCSGATYCYSVEYTADFTNFTGASQNQNYFSAIAFQPPGSITYVYNSLTTATTSIANNLAAKGCGGTTGAQWVCTSFDSMYPTTGVDNFYYYVGLGSPGDFGTSSIKMLFFSSPTSTQTSGLMSCSASDCTTTTVPEPATLALFAAGLAALGFALSRRRRKA